MLYEKYCLKSLSSFDNSHEHSIFVHLLRTVTVSVLLTFHSQKAFSPRLEFSPCSTDLRVALPDDPSRHLSPNQSLSTKAAVAVNGTLVSPGFS